MYTNEESYCDGVGGGNGAVTQVILRKTQPDKEKYRHWRKEDPNGDTLIELRGGYSGTKAALR